MNKLLIPPSPNWYESDVAACAPDNTLLYGARNDFVVIKPTPSGQPDDVHIFTRAHNARVLSVNVNKNWGNPHKLAVTVSEDKIVKLWDIDTLEKKLSHNKHLSHDPIRGAAFAGDDRVISVSENGVIVVWNVTLNETNVITSLFEGKTAVTCMSICPHASWLAAFGLRSGLVIVADLRKTGRIIYKLRGHDKQVISLAWCPVPINVFPVKPQNKVGVAKPMEAIDSPEQQNKVTNGAINETKEESTENDTKEATTKETAENGEEKVVYKLNLKENPWANLKFSDDDDPKVVENEQGSEKIKSESEQSIDEYLKECQELRNQILKLSSPEPTKTEVSNEPEEKPRAILKAKSKTQNTVFEEGIIKEENENKSTDNSCLSCDSAVSSKKKSTDQSDNESSCDLNVTDCSKKSSDLSFHSIDDVLDEKETDKNGKGQETSDPNKNIEAPDADKIVADLKQKFKEDRLHKKEKDSSSATSDWRKEIPGESHYEIEEPRKEFLLASSAKEGAIYVWRAGTDGRLQTFFSVPYQKHHGKKPYNKYEKIWITLCWIAPKILLSSSKTSELLQWNLPKPKDHTKLIRSIHKDHCGMIFNITGPVTLLNDQNWLENEDRPLNVWTLGQDRMVINSGLGSEKTTLGCYPTLGGAVSCFAGSPVDPNRLAMGTTDAEILIWDLSREHTKRIVFTRFHQKIQSRVMCLAWHPIIETSLAYGTLEGRVGIVDTNHQGKSPKLLPDFFKTQIYRIEWGPKPDSKDYCLYVAAGGKVAIFDSKTDEKDPTLLDVPDNTIVHTFSWKPDYKMLLVSAKSGELIIYNVDLTIQHISYLPDKLCSIVWHPDACSSDSAMSKYSKVFACVVKSLQVIVYDLSVESEQNEDRIVAKFDNSDRVINSMAWSPHDGKHLVVGDEYGIAQVYDIESKSRIATFVDPDFENILSVVWSPVDPQFIINGQWQKLLVWKISEYPPIDLEEIDAKRKVLQKALKKEQTDQLPKGKLAEIEAKEPKSSKPVKSGVLPIFYGVRPETQSADIRKLIDYREGVENLELAIGDGKNVDVLQVFGKNSDMVNLVDKNILTLRKSGKYISCNNLTLWKGDISTEIKQAIEAKRVNPNLITMSAIFAPKLLQTACEVYVEQLMDKVDADPIEIVTYLLACHKVEGAIKVLCDNQLFKEALALAKCRLPQDDPIILEVLEKWAKNNMFIGNFELAAMCYITLGKFEDASSVLFRRSTPELLQLSADLAKKSGNQEIYKAIMFRLEAFKNHQESTGQNGLQKSPPPEKADEIPLPDLKEIITSQTKYLEETVTSSDQSELNLTNCMTPEVLVNELEYCKNCDSQIFDRSIEEDYFYQLALASQGFLQNQNIDEILKKNLSPIKPTADPQQNGASPDKSNDPEN